MEVPSEAREVGGTTGRSVDHTPSPRYRRYVHFGSRHLFFHASYSCSNRFLFLLPFIFIFGVLPAGMLVEQFYAKFWNKTVTKILIFAQVTYTWSSDSSGTRYANGDQRFSGYCCLLRC
jgi:hypothetical protein